MAARGLRTSWATPAATRPSEARRLPSASSRLSRSCSRCARPSSAASSATPSATSASSRISGRGTGASRSRCSVASADRSVLAPRRIDSARWPDVATSARPASPIPIARTRQAADHGGACTGITAHAILPWGVLRAPAVTVTPFSATVCTVGASPADAVTAPTAPTQSGSSAGRIESGEAPGSRYPARIPTLAGRSTGDSGPSAWAMVRWNSSCWMTISRLRSSRCVEEVEASLENA